MIPPQTIDKIFSAAKIEEVVQDYVPLKKRGANLIGLCPFHSERTGSFTVSPSKGIFMLITTRRSYERLCHRR